jgi:pimeloyl-ACP methyl ester carboxylesterase
MTEILSKDGVPIFCQSAGGGPPLLLVHGSGSDSASWRPILPELASRFTVLCMDRRGHGRSGDAGTYAIEKEAGDIAACIETLVDGPCDVVGHSYGGLCVLAAARAGAPIRRLVLFEPPIPTYAQAYYPDDLIETMRAELARGDSDAAAEAFVTGVFRTSAEELAEMKKLAMWQQIAGRAHIVLRELETVDRFKLSAAGYRGWSIPTLLMLGSESPPQYRATIEALHAILPGSSIATLKGQQHSAARTAPALFAATVRKFLKARTLKAKKPSRLREIVKRRARGA